MYDSTCGLARSPQPAVIMTRQRRVRAAATIHWALLPRICSFYVLLGCLCPGLPAKANPERPNVILIMADDIGYECFGCYGSQQYQTPNIDRLAKRGMLFTQCHAQPLCTPSRIKLMTGLSNARNYSAFGVLNRNQKTLGQYFRDTGYTTAAAGKWQLYGADHYPPRFRGRGTLPEQAGFQHVCLWQVDRLGERYHGPLMYLEGKNRQYSERQYGPQVATEYLQQFMRQHRDRPFLVYYPMILVHSPFVPTPDSASRDRRDRQLNFQDMVTYMDQLVGSIVQTTEELGIANRTLILFATDNGTHRSLKSELRGRTVQGGKGLTTDAGTRVPLLAHWPGVIPPGSVCKDLIDFSDFLPTLLDVIDHDAAASLDGQSFFPQLRGKVGTPREWIYCYYCPRPERTKPVRFVRDHRWKLYGDGRFFDVQNDVLERRPLQTPTPGSPADLARQKLLGALSSLPAEGQSLLRFSE